MGYSHLPIKFPSCPSDISQFASFVQKWLLSLEPTKDREKRHLFLKHKEPLWRCSPLFTFKCSFWCQLRSIEICLHWLFKKKKKITQVSERQNKPLSSSSVIVYAARQRLKIVGIHLKGKGIGTTVVMVPAQAGGELQLLVQPLICMLCRLWMHLELIFTVHMSHHFHGEMVFLAFSSFT